MPTLIEVEVPASENLNPEGLLKATSERYINRASQMKPFTAYGQVNVKATSCQLDENHLLPGRDQNETTFDDSATVLSKNLLGDESTLPNGEESYITKDATNIDDSVRVPSNSIHQNRAHRHRESNEHSNYDDDSVTLLADTTFHMPEDLSRSSSSSAALEPPNLHPIRALGINPRVNLQTTPPHQTRYQRDYQRYVKNTIQDFKNRFPNKIRDYHKMSLEERQQSQLHVIELLARLRIGKANGSDGNDQSHTECVKHGMKATPVRVVRNQMLSPGQSPIFREEADEGSFCDLGDSSHDHTSNDMNEAGNTQADISAIQLSSTLSGQMSKDNQSAFSRLNLDSGASVSNGSVELPRASESMSDQSHIFESPERPRINSSKRSASASGKRGADLTRRRPNSEFSPARFEDNIYEGAALRLSDRMERLSLSPGSLSEPRDLFVASQSPISPGLTQRPNDSFQHIDDNGTQISWDEGSDNESNRGDSVESLDTSIDYGRHNPRGKQRTLRELPVNVQLKAGARLHLNKLDVKHATPPKKKGARRKDNDSRKYRLVNFPDPFLRYSGRQRVCLHTVYDWISRSQGHDNDSLAGAVFSLSFSHIVAVALRILLKDARRRSGMESRSSNHVNGQTIIVVRTKEDAAKWANALREGTGCSVFNHSTLPLSERIRKPTAELAAAHDVVLTTYDALKSPDVTVPMDESGHAIIGAVGSSNGWYSSRSASQQHHSTPQACKQFSVLHRIVFERVIFLDVLGRKGFLGKTGTARAAAATALRAESRFVFFVKCEIEGMSAVSALRKCDRRAIQSVSSVLHLGLDHVDEDEDGEDEAVFEDYMLDVRDLLK